MTRSRRARPEPSWVNRCFGCPASCWRTAANIRDSGAKLGAATIYPPIGFNRLVFGDRFKAVFPSHDPAIFMRLRWGASTDLIKTNNLLLNEGSTYTDREQKEAVLDFSFIYGLPGKTGYEYNRPFDYFAFEFAGQTSAHGHDFVQDIMVRGLLYGTDYEVGESYRGIWGLYGSYDYIAPPIFRVSSTAAFARNDRTVVALAPRGYAGIGPARRRLRRRRHHSAGRRPARLPLWCDPQGLLAAALHLRPSDHARFHGA